MSCRTSQILEYTAVQSETPREENMIENFSSFFFPPRGTCPERMLQKLFLLHSLQICSFLSLRSSEISFMRLFSVPSVKGHPFPFGTLLPSSSESLNSHSLSMPHHFFFFFFLYSVFVFH